MDQLLAPDAVRRLYETIFSLSAKGLELVTGDPMAAQMSWPPESRRRRRYPLRGLRRRDRRAYHPGGWTVTPCRRLPIALGRVGEDSLREIWATSPVLEQLRDRSRYQGKCGDCKRWSACRGCRAIAYAYAQSQGNPDFLAPIPSVLLRQINQEDEKNMVERPGVITMKGKPLTLVGQEVKVGDPAPDFEVLANDLSPFKLSSLKGKVCHYLLGAVPGHPHLRY